MVRLRNLIRLASVPLVLCAGPVLAANHALLVGASTYDNLDERWWLKGPANDVVLVRDYLTGAAPEPFAPENVIVLADGVEGAAKPTLAAIRAAFARLADVAEEGDFVYLHFSGHGSQTPARDPDSEVDGFDETFLPVDIGPWSDEISVVENALIDDEIGELIGAIRAKGATVWAVFDSCHSGTVTRAAPTGEEEVRMRKLDPAALGIPDDVLDAAATRSRALPDPRARPESPAAEALADTEGGAFVAFYAAQTNETTPEKRLPRGEEGRKSQGVFTFTIFETLAAHPGLTYRQLGQEVLRRYAVQNLAQATPMFEGDLDAIVFSGTPGEPVRQWPLKQGEFGPKINAGHLQGLSEGDRLALLPSAVATSDQAIGYAEIVYADTFLAELEPVAHAGLAAPEQIPDGGFARKVEASVDFTLRIALPDETTDKVAAALEKLPTELGPRMTLVAAGEPADVRLAMIPDGPVPDALWLLPPTGFFDPDQALSTPGVRTAARTEGQIAIVLAEQLQAMGRAINLLRLAGQYDQTDIAVDLRLQTKNRRQRKLTDMDMSSVPRLTVNDQVHVLLRNRDEFSIDVNVLHVGSNHEISHFLSTRLHPDGVLKKGLFYITDKAFGRDRVVIVLTPVTDQPVLDLSFLAQGAVTLRKGPGDGTDAPPGPPSFADAVREAGFGVTTRSAQALDDDSGPSPSILQFDIDAVPPD